MRQGIAACHGIAIEPGEIGYELGWLDQLPARRVGVQLAEAIHREPAAQLVWELEEPPEFGLPAITSQTWVESDDRVWYGNTLNLTMRLDHREGVISVAARNGNHQVVLEALASIALPMVAQRDGALVLHASAAAQGDRALMFCAPGGSGKSSLLVGLVAAGWRAVSEDQCVIDFDSTDRRLVWPGPSWVRFKQGVPPVPPVSRARFEALDKVAFALDEWMAHAPAVVERIVFIESPGGEKPVWKPLSVEAAIPRLLRQATWLHQRDDFVATVSPAVLALVQHVPAFSMRLPWRADWLRYGVDLIERNWDC